MKIKRYIKRILNPKAAKKVAAKKAARQAAKRAADDLFADLERSLSYIFKNKELLRQALTHPGSANITKNKLNTNQRLEFLGDSVLQCVISDEVFRSFPEKPEGDLTKTRIALTQGTFLADLAESMGIGKFLIVPKGSESLRSAKSAWEDALEALIGAIYLDSNFDTVKKIVMIWYAKIMADLDRLVVNQNPKGSLQEAAVKKGQSVAYTLVSQFGPDHDKKFEVEVSIDGVAYASATASSKKIAETKAAKAALKKYLNEDIKDA